MVILNLIEINMDKNKFEIGENLGETIVASLFIIGIVLLMFFGKCS